jgi:hypothetical protein
VRLGTKEGESGTGCVWAARFRRFTPRSRLALFETYELFIYLIFQFFSDHGKMLINKTVDIESIGTGARLYCISVM